MRNDVLVLGAGFSKAMSPQMPLSDELGEACLRLVGDASGGGARLPVKRSSGWFERFLSRLAEDQPDLSAEENLRNRALFVQLTRVMPGVLASAEGRVVSQAAKRLVEAAHERGATLISFNYDTIVERAVEASGLARWADVIGHVPPLPPPFQLPAQEFERPGPTLQLLKLHGSLNWFWSFDDRSGTSIVRWPLEHDGTGATDRINEALPGLVPFIIPPASAKTSYYANRVTRSIWARARKALLEADVVTLVGYSIPHADLVFTSMLSEAVVGRMECRVRVVDPQAADVERRLRSLGVDSDRLAPAIDGQYCVERLSQEWESRA